MRKIIDASFEVISGPTPKPAWKTLDFWRWAFFIARAVVFIPALILTIIVGLSGGLSDKQSSEPRLPSPAAER